MARPVFNSSRAVDVQFAMTLVQLLDFDETKQLLITSVWKSYQWIDENLSWNPADYDGLEDIRLPPSITWTPDIVLYNNADEQYNREIHHELLAVMHNGLVKWIPSAIYRSSCPVNMANFPFDVQTCHFKFGSWTYDGNKLNLHFLNSTGPNIDLREYVNSSEWDMLSCEAKRSIRYYPCCGSDPYPELIYSVTVRRRTAFYIVVLILPCILLSCLTVVMFWFPPQRPDRTGLGMSLFSSFFVLLLILVQSSPPTSASISLLGIIIVLM
ncbi:DgyrCDS5676 [Dimorphilus gyrociliatus]|nr:DgyrCDS5676 [Dimorphilus gyrociliatus]